LPSLKIIYDAKGWAYHNKALALQKYAPSDFEVSIVSLPRPEVAASALENEPVDLVFLLGESKVRAVREILQQRRWRSKLVAGWSCGFPHRLGEFYAMRDAADAWIFNNQECWDRTGRLPRTHMIANGVDLEVFKVTRPLADRAPAVLWVGSERYRRLKGYEHFLLPLQEQLRAAGIACELLLADSAGPHKRTPQQMADWYNRGTVFVCASESEGTPNPALEAAACGCTVVSTRVGNMPELIRDDVNGYLVDWELAALSAGVQMACEHYHRLATHMQTDVQAWHWAERSGEFFRLFREILDGCGEPRAPRPDLSAELTVFVTTVGAPTFENCLAHLRDQDCAYTLQVIDRLAPMNVAFQRMLDECRTPYYVQVDEDMLLYPHAVRTLYEMMRDAGSHVAIVAADLYDVHVKRRIVGVKIFRHAIVRRYPLDAVEEFEKLQVERLEADGYLVVRTKTGTTPAVGPILGLHGTQWTPQSIYERYATLERRRRAYPRQMRWVREHHAEFLQRFLEDPSELNFFALLGLIAGTLASANGQALAKDYRTYAALPGFEALRRFLADFEPPVREDGEDVS
jgi:glycosyl transferase family 1